MSQRQEAGGRHGIAGVGIQAADVNTQLARDDRHDYRHQYADRENGGQAAGYQVKLIEKAAHAYLLARKLSMTFWPSGPARLIHSASMVSPTLSRHRSEERRVGKECVSTCRSRWSPYH